MQLAENKNLIFPGQCKMMIMSNIVLNIRVINHGREGRGGGLHAMLKVGTTNPKINVFF